MSEVIKQPVGRRAFNKADKLQKISAAARDLFLEKGYDGATLRDIAARAGVGFGTLFDYASGKRDLLFLIFNPRLVERLDAGYKAALAEPRFLDQAMKLFEPFYALYERDPELSRYLLRELNFYRDGAEAAKFLTQRSDFLDRLKALTERAQIKGEINPACAPSQIAQVLMSIFAWEVRRWISLEPLDLAVGLNTLRGLVALQINGFRS